MVKKQDESIKKHDKHKGIRQVMDYCGTDEENKRDE